MKYDSHKKAQRKAAGKNGSIEVKKGRKIIDAVTQSGKRITEVERSGDPKLLEKAAKRLKSRKSNQKVLQTPQKDMEKGAEAMIKVGVKGTVKNMGGTKRRST